jgi:hypothetical protein
MLFLQLKVISASATGFSITNPSTLLLLTARIASGRRFNELMSAFSISCCDTKTGNVMLIRKSDKNKFHTLKDFSNKKVAAQKGTEQEKLYFLLRNFFLFSPFLCCNFFIRKVF